MSEKWVASLHDEMWPGDNEHDDREAAIAYGREEFEGDPFFVGVKVPVTTTEMVSDAAREMVRAGYDSLNESMGELVGEVADTWPDFNDDELIKAIAAVLRFHVPTVAKFFMVDQIEHIEAEED